MTPRTCLFVAALQGLTAFGEWPFMSPQQQHIKISYQVVTLTKFLIMCSQKMAKKEKKQLNMYCISLSFLRFRNFCVSGCSVQRHRRI
jgi:hypothetical protein